MDFLGYDSIVFTCASIRTILPTFVAQLREHWQDLQMDVERLDAEDNTERIKTVAECLNFIGDECHSIVFFYRDEEMRQRFDEAGYTLGSNVQEPFSVHFRKREKIHFDLDKVREISSDKKTIGHVRSYGATLYTPELLEITLASSENPAQNLFSDHIFRLILFSIFSSETFHKK